MNMLFCDLFDDDEVSEVPMQDGRRLQAINLFHFHENNARSEIQFAGELNELFHSATMQGRIKVVANAIYGALMSMVIGNHGQAS